MSFSRQPIWRIPDRLSPLPARWVLALAALMLPITALGLFVYDGWHRVAYVSAFLLIALANGLLAVGSLMPEGPVAVGLRGATRPMVVLMFIALAVSLGFQAGLW